MPLPSRCAPARLIELAVLRHDAHASAASAAAPPIQRRLVGRLDRRHAGFGRDALAASLSPPSRSASCGEPIHVIPVPAGPRRSRVLGRRSRNRDGSASARPARGAMFSPSRATRFRDRFRRQTRCAGDPVVVGRQPTATVPTNLACRAEHAQCRSPPGLRPSPSATRGTL